MNFGIRLPVNLIERADARAELEDRTRTQVIRRALREHLAKAVPGEHADAEHRGVQRPESPA
jgi:metal-responsive CopG/Arc/MetJ family transcriptional regulator